MQPLAFAIALLLPALALSGFASAGFYLWPSIENVGGMQKYNVDLAGMSDKDRALMAGWRSGLEWGFWILLGGTLLARWLRTRIRHPPRAPRLGLITAPVGRSILEAIRDEGCRTPAYAAGARAAPPAGCA